ncbi:syntaxin-71 [Artemisia annua]|uniref:Syntaxin-71 n=1 Tax=Artemisia annua TaxID=35608 RepID=A0A2U1PDH9_ARTAN|nr:syntaxin-71 [Artemisia annua]
MTNSTPPPPSTLTLVEKLYAVHNINNLVPVKLDLDELNYSSWCYFFIIHCQNFGVLTHIQGTAATTSTTPPPTDEWETADSIVKSWIFLTLSPTLQRRLIKTNPKTAKPYGTKSEAIFQEKQDAHRTMLSKVILIHLPQVLLTETTASRTQASRNNRDHDPRNTNVRTDVCRNFGRGYCRWGDTCRFIHDASRATNTQTPPGNPRQHNGHHVNHTPGSQPLVPSGLASAALNFQNQQQLLALLQAQNTLLAQCGILAPSAQHQFLPASSLGSRPMVPPGFQSVQHQPTNGFSPQQQALYSSTVQPSTPKSMPPGQETRNILHFGEIKHVYDLVVVYMGVSDLITRVDAICKKYEKYDIDKLKDANNNINTKDAFASLYTAIESDLDQVIEKSEVAAAEKNRAFAVALNAEIRRSKARLLEELPKLQHLAFKKVKGLSKDELEARNELVSALKERIEVVPDGATRKPQPTHGLESSSSNRKIKFGSTLDGTFDNTYYQQTDETNKFREEYEMRRLQQDEGLEVIAQGLGTLKNMAKDMQEEVDRQMPLMDEIDDKVDRATSDLKNTNVRLKDTVTKLRSSRNVCCDIILLCLILGIAAYLYNILK